MNTQNKVRFHISVTIKVICLLILLFGSAIAFVIKFQNNGTISLISAICLLLAMCLVSFFYLFWRFLKPLDDLIRALTIVDFDSDIVDCTYVDNLEEKGSFEMKLLVVKFKYLIDIITARINQYNDETKKSEHDELTGCYNRVHLNRVKPWYENQPNMFIIFIDVNNLKKMNDIFGHDAGDALLRNAASKLRFWNSYGDVYRLGGDEFMIVLTNKKYDFCMRLLKTWYPTVGVLNRTEDGFKCVLSYGIAEGKRGSSFDELEKLADDNMYEMKVRVKKEFGEEMR